MEGLAFLNNYSIHKLILHVDPFNLFQAYQTPSFI